MLADRYELQKIIGKGSFGEIWLAEDRAVGRQVAVKLEKDNCPHPQLQHEAKVLRRLQGGPGIPHVFDVGSSSAMIYMVLDLLGPTIEELLSICKPHLSVKSVAMIGEQVLCRLHYIHSKHYIHRDMKPDNWLIGRDSREHLVFVVDFGLAKKFRDPTTEQHIEYKEGKSLTGTSRYTSLNTHLGIEQSRRDDIEGLAYVLIYLLRGSLPWQGLIAKSKSERYRKIMDQKMSLPISTICHGLPPEFAQLLTYARGLSFTQGPDYSSLRRSLKAIIERLRAEYDFRFDWSGLMEYRYLVEWKSKVDAQKPSGGSQDGLKETEKTCLLF